VKATLRKNKPMFFCLRPMLWASQRDLLSICNPKAYVVVLGDTTPLSPVLIEYGVDAISGTMVVDSEQAFSCVSQGANFKQIRGIRLLTIMK
jgi:uncharacterized protein